MAVDNYSLLFYILSFTSLLGKCSEVEENKQILRILYRRCDNKVYFMRVEGNGQRMALIPGQGAESLRGVGSEP